MYRREQLVPNMESLNTQ